MKESGNRGDLHVKCSLQRLHIRAWGLRPLKDKAQGVLCKTEEKKVHNILLIVTARVPKFRHLLMGSLKKETHLHLMNSSPHFSWGLVAVCISAAERL